MSHKLLRRRGRSITIGLLLLCLLSATPLAAQDRLRYLGDEVTTRAFMLDLATLFQAETGIEVWMATTSAAAAIDSTLNGKADLGGVSRPVLDEAAREQLQHYTIAWDALVLIAHPGNIANGLSATELRQVLTGEIDNWSKLGGFAQEVKLYLPRDIDAGVASVLRHLAFDQSGAAIEADLRFDTLEELQTAVAAVPNALGISSYSRVMAFPDLPVKLLAYNNVVPNQDSIAEGKYLLFQPLYLVAQADNVLAERFIRFAQGSLARRIMRRGDVVPYMDGFSLIARQFERMNSGQTKDD